MLAKSSGCFPRVSHPARGVRDAIRLAGRNPQSLVHLFAPSWARVDRARAALARRGLQSRVSVHHRAALAWSLAILAA